MNIRIYLPWFKPSNRISILFIHSICWNFYSILWILRVPSPFFFASPFISSEINGGFLNIMHSFCRFFCGSFFLTRTHTHFTAHFRCCCCYLMGCLLFRLNYTHNYYRSMHLSTDAETGEQENRQQNCELTYKKRWKKRTHTHKNGIKFEIPMFCGLRVLLINYLPSSFMCLADRVVSKWIRGRVFDLHSPGIRGIKEKWLLVICSTVFFVCFNTLY